MALLVMLLSLLLTAAISVVLLPKTLHLLAELVGQRLRHSSRTRRELLLDRVAAETRAFEAAHTATSKDDDDWEKIVPSPSGSAVIGGGAGAEWNGIVGFFHPFWWVAKDMYVHSSSLTEAQQCRRRRRAGAVGGHTRDAEALAQGSLRSLHR
jgi:hypothetical protein